MGQNRIFFETEPLNEGSLYVIFGLLLAANILFLSVNVSTGCISVNRSVWVVSEIHYVHIQSQVHASLLRKPLTHFSSRCPYTPCNTTHAATDHLKVAHIAKESHVWMLYGGSCDTCVTAGSCVQTFSPSVLVVCPWLAGAVGWGGA